jgi:hypothetical protein
LPDPAEVVPVQLEELDAVVADLADPLQRGCELVGALVANRPELKANLRHEENPVLSLVCRSEPEGSALGSSGSSRLEAIRASRRSCLA